MQNQRIRLTKTMLKDALLCLLEEKNIDKITIQAICARAQINRTTFYKYYGSQYDLLEDIENDFFAELEKYLLSNENVELNAMLHIMEFLQVNQTNFRHMLKSCSSQDFAERLFSLPFIRTSLDHTILNLFPDSQKDYVHRFIFNGSYAIIRKWIDQGCQESPAEIAELVFYLCNALYQQCDQSPYKKEKSLK